MTKRWRPAKSLREGKNGWTRWFGNCRPIVDAQPIVCCDCGLTHRFQFKVLHGKVKVRVQLMPELTAKYRPLKRRKLASMVRK